VFQVGFRGQDSQFVGRKLPPQEVAKPVAKLEARAAQPYVVTKGTLEVHQLQAASALAKALPSRTSLSSVSRLDAAQTPHQIAVFIPGSQA
jgi:hypothetical protein